MHPNASSIEVSTPVNPHKVGAFEEYVSYCALGGLITSEDGQLSRMTTSQFCQQFSIDRKTAYRWKHMPGFGNRVRQRREELFPMARESAMWNRLYLIALQSRDLKAAVGAIKLLLGHFSGLRLPSRRTPEPEGQGSLMELVSLARRRGIIDT